MTLSVEASLLLLLLLATVAVTSSVALVTLMINRRRVDHQKIATNVSIATTDALLHEFKSVTTAASLYESLNEMFGRSADDWINVVATWMLSTKAAHRPEAVLFGSNRQRGPVNGFLERLAEAWLATLTDQAEADLYRDSTV